MVTDEQLKEWRKLATAATPGEWEYQALIAYNIIGLPFVDGYVVHTDEREIADIQCETPDDTPKIEANARFIAAARTAVPALLDEVERLRAEIKRRDDALTEQRNMESWRAYNATAQWRGKPILDYEDWLKTFQKWISAPFDEVDAVLAKYEKETGGVMRTPLTNEQLNEMTLMALSAKDDGYFDVPASETAGTILSLIEEVRVQHQVTDVYRQEYRGLTEDMQELINNAVLNERSKHRVLINLASKVCVYLKGEWVIRRDETIFRLELPLGHTCYVWTSDSDSPGFLADMASLYHTVERFEYPDEEYAGFTFHTPQPSEPNHFFRDGAREAMERELP